MHVIDRPPRLRRYMRSNLLLLPHFPNFLINMAVISLLSQPPLRLPLNPPLPHHRTITAHPRLLLLELFIPLSVLLSLLCQISVFASKHASVLHLFLVFGVIFHIPCINEVEGCFLFLNFCRNLRNLWNISVKILLSLDIFLLLLPFSTFLCHWFPVRLSISILFQVALDDFVMNLLQFSRVLNAVLS